MNEQDRKAEIAKQQASIRAWRAQQQNKKYMVNNESNEQRKQALLNEYAGLEGSITDAEMRIRALGR